MHEIILKDLPGHVRRISQSEVKQEMRKKTAAALNTLPSADEIVHLQRNYTNNEKDRSPVSSSVNLQKISWKCII